MRLTKNNLLKIFTLIAFGSASSFGQRMDNNFPNNQNQPEQQGFANIEGSVKGSDGKPMPGAQLRIDRAAPKGSFNVKADKNGKYMYGNLPIGEYTVSLLVDGKVVQEKKTHTHVEVLAGSPSEQYHNPHVDFNLSISGASGGSGSGISVDGESADPALAKQQEAEKDKQQKAIDEKNKALQALVNAGVDAKTAKNWDAAIENLDKARVMSPTQDVVWYHLGSSYMLRSDTKTGDEQQADIQKALESFAKATELKTTQPLYHSDYAMALIRAKKLDQAQSELANAAQLDAPGGRYYFNVAIYYINLGQNDPAEQALKKTIDVDPTFAEAYFQYGIVLLNRASRGTDGTSTAPPGTAEAFQKYLSLKPDGPNAEAAKGLLSELGAKVSTSFQAAGSDKKQTNTKKTK